MIIFYERVLCARRLVRGARSSTHPCSVGLHRYLVNQVGRFERRIRRWRCRRRWCWRCDRQERSKLRSTSEQIQFVSALATVNSHMMILMIMIITIIIILNIDTDCYILPSVVNSDQQSLLIYNVSQSSDRTNAGHLQ